MVANAALRCLSAFGFSYQVKVAEHRAFEVVALTGGEAAVVACAIVDSDTLTYLNYRRVLPVRVHALRGDVHLCDDAIVANLSPIDPRD